MDRRTIVICLALLSGLAAARAEQLPLGPDLTASGWQELKVPGRRADSFAATADVVSVSSERSVSFLYLPVATLARDKPVLSWQWRVDRDIAPTDMSAKGKDDRALALHVWYPASDATRSSTGLRRMFARMIGVPDWGRALTYVWGGTQPVGTMIDNPYMDGREGKLIILKTTETPTEIWMAERVDLAADYRKAFGAEPPSPRFIALSSDTDDTGQSARGSFTAIEFLPPSEIKDAPP